MKKILWIILILIQASCFLDQKRKPDLPIFNILLPDSITVFNTSQIPIGKTIVLFYFSPDCEHCQEETKNILQNMASLKNAQFYFITTDPFDRLLVYNKYYKINQFKNITLGRDFEFSFPIYKKGIIPPYLAIYDKEKRLREEFKGETMEREIISCIND